MPESENKPNKVIYLRDTTPSGGSHQKRIEILDYLTPQEAARAGEEGWSRVVAEMGGAKN
ncbi:MAG: hypothetical protein ABFD97_11515 [Syntrophobacter sp.]